MELLVAALAFLLLAFLFEWTAEGEEKTFFGAAGPNPFEGSARALHIASQRGGADDVPSPPPPTVVVRRPS